MLTGKWILLLIAVAVVTEGTMVSSVNVHFECTSHATISCCGTINTPSNNASKPFSPNGVYSIPTNESLFDSQSLSFEDSTLRTQATESSTTGRCNQSAIWIKREVTRILEMHGH